MTDEQNIATLRAHYDEAVGRKLDKVIITHRRRLLQAALQQQTRERMRGYACKS